MSEHEETTAEELLGQAKSGGAEALARLLDAYRNYLRLLARIHVDEHLQSKADPSDLVQETHMYAVRDFPQFRGTTEAEFVAWLRRVLARTAAMFVRQYVVTQARDVRLERQINETIDSSSMALHNMLVARELSPSQHASRREAAVVLANALAQLPDDYREVMILHHLEGRSIRETAKRMGRSMDSVKKLLARAVIKLRRQLENPPKGGFLS